MGEEHTLTSELWGMTFDWTAIISSVLVAAIVFIIVYVAARGCTLAPKAKGMQNLLEMGIDFARSMIDTGIDDRVLAGKLLPFVFMLFMYVFVANQFGLLISAITTEHLVLLKSPTADISVVLSLSVLVSVIAQYVGIKRSIKSYLISFLNPFHILEEFIKVFTHTLRLFANIFVGELLLGLMLHGNALLLGIPILAWIGFSLIIGLIQAYIFTTLTAVYIGQKVTH